MSKETFWLGKANVGYFPVWAETKAAIDNIKKFGWDVATESQLTDAWKMGANWCAAGITKFISPTLGDIGIYYSLYPISEESSRISGGCGYTLAIQKFAANAAGNSVGVNGVDKIGGINVYGVKPNPDFPETVPSGSNARWSDSTKSNVLIDINGNTYIIYPFNNVKKYYNSPDVVYNLLRDIEKTRFGYILPASCPKIDPNYVPAGYVLSSACDGKITYVDKIVEKVVEKIPDGYIDKKTCPVTYVDRLITADVPSGYIKPSDCPIPDGYVKSSNCPNTSYTPATTTSSDSETNNVIFFYLFIVTLILLIIVSCVFIYKVYYKKSLDSNSN